MFSPRIKNATIEDLMHCDVKKWTHKVGSEFIAASYFK